MYTVCWTKKKREREESGWKGKRNNSKCKPQCSHVKGGQKLSVMWRQREVPDGSEV